MGRAGSSSTLQQIAALPQPTARFSGCPPGTWGDYVTGKCATSCSPGEGYDQNTSSCVTSCPAGDSCSGLSSAPTISNTTSSNDCLTNADTGLVCCGGVCAYAPLEPLPGVAVTTTSDQGFVAYLNGIIRLLIIIGAMLAVVRFSIGGIMYMTSDIANTRAKAKSQIWACVWGLLLLISSVLILQTLNPQLVQFNFPRSENLGGSGQATTNTSPTTICNGGTNSSCLQQNYGI